MASAATMQTLVPAAQLGASISEQFQSRVVPQSSFLGSSAKKSAGSVFGANQGKYRVVCQAQVRDRWAGLGNDISDDQQDITRGKGMVDSLFQGAAGYGTQNAVMASYDYISQGQRNYQWDNMKDGYYIAPAFMDKIVVHLAKNFMSLPNIKVPLILGVWGGKGQGKSFQAELIFSKLGINPIVMSAGELESGNAGEPAKLIRQRYREASDIIKKGKMCCLFINDLDAGAGRMGGTTQYTVNNQMVNATLMNIADNPTNVQLPGVYNKEDIPRVPVIVTGNDFSTLYAPLIRDGRMEKFYWAPTREDRIGVCEGIFRTDGVSKGDVTTIVDTFPGQSIDFFGALRARVYDDEVRKWVAEVGVENIGKKLVNSRDGPPKFEKPAITLERLLDYGYMLVKEQENVKRVQLADKYLDGAELGNANEDAIAEGAFFQGSTAQQFPVPVKEGCADPNAINYDPTARSDNGSCVYDFAEPKAWTPAEIVPILPSSSSPLRGRGFSGRGRGGPPRRTVVRAYSGNSSGFFSTGSDGESESYSSGISFFDAPVETAEIIPILPSSSMSIRAGGVRNRKRGLPRVPKARGENGAYFSSASDSDTEGYYSDSFYSSSSAPTRTAEIVPIVAKSPSGSRGRGILGRKRGPPKSRRPRGENVSSGSESEAEGYYSDSVYSSSMTPAEVSPIIPILPKSPTSVRGRGLRKRGLPRGPKARSDVVYSSSGSGSDSEGYYSDSVYSSSTAPAETSPIIPILPKSPAALRGRGLRSRKRGLPRGPRARGEPGYSSSGSGSDSDGYYSDSVYSSSTAPAGTATIIPIIAKTPANRGRGILSKRGLRQGPKGRGMNGGYASGGYSSGGYSSSGSGNDSDGYYSDSVYSSSTAPAETATIIPIIAKTPAKRGRGILSKRGLRKVPKARSENGGYSSGGYSSSGSASDSEGYYSDSVYSSFESPTEITPIIAKASPATRGRGLGSRKRGLPRGPKVRSGNGPFSSSSDSESEGYFSDSAYSYQSAEPEPVVPITPIYPKTTLARGARGRGRGRR